jgi:TPR repeat protein
MENNITKRYIQLLQKQAKLAISYYDNNNITKCFTLANNLYNNNEIKYLKNKLRYRLMFVLGNILYNNTHNKSIINKYKSFRILSYIIDNDGLKYLYDKIKYIVMLLLGFMYYNGIVTKKNYEKSFILLSDVYKTDIFKFFTVADCCVLQKVLGDIYYHNKCYTEAFSHYMFIYKHQDKLKNVNIIQRVICALANMYHNGIGTKQDDVKAFNLSNESINNCSTLHNTNKCKITYTLGICYYNGIGTTQNYKKATEYFTKFINFVNDNNNNKLKSNYIVAKRILKNIQK